MPDNYYGFIRLKNYMLEFEDGMSKDDPSDSEQAKQTMLGARKMVVKNFSAAKSFSNTQLFSYSGFVIPFWVEHFQDINNKLVRIQARYLM